MSPALLILRPGDEARLAHLHARGFARAWSETGWRGTLERPGALVLGIECDGELAAAIAVQFTPDEAEVLTLVTAPQHRRKGLARHLVEAARRRAGARGCSRMTLDVSLDNRPARALYRSLGFLADGVRRGFYSDGSDGLLLSLDLGVSAGQGDETGPFSGNEPD